MQLAFVGIGWMGAGMSINLQKYLNANGGGSLLIYNRSHNAHLDQLKELGAEIVNDLSVISTRADVIFSCLSNDQVVNQVYDQLLSGGKEEGKKDTIYVEMSTLYPETVVQLSKRVGEDHFLSCPVFGPPAAAASANLIMALSGKSSLKTKVEKYLCPAMGKKILDLGEDLSKSTKMKLIGNYFITGVLAMLSEGLTLGEKTGLGEQPVVDFLEAFFPNTSFGVYSKRMVEDSFVVDTSKGEKALFSTTLAAKDLGHIQSLGKEYGVPTEVTNIMKNRIDQSIERFGPDYDMSSVYAVVRQDSGLPPTHKKE